MSNRTIQMTDRLYDYMLNVTSREHPQLAELRAETARMPRAGMQIAPEQGQFMAMLVKLLGARRTLEIGVFTGYSSLAVALALPHDGRVVALDISEEWTRVGRRYWQAAGVADKVDLRVGPAAESLEALVAEGRTSEFDFAFIDADKERYDTYYELALKLVRPGGVIAIDNVLWGGAVADPDDQDADTRALRALNEKLHGDTRIDLAMVPIGDGLTLARKL
ncbi:MAG: class I SAM-dependent methyltransferase [Candidatus Sericytochromatia bacterium]